MRRKDGGEYHLTLEEYATVFPTPTADAAIGAVPTPEMAERFRSKGRSGSFVEAVAATMWPTPTAYQGHNNSAMNAGTGGRAMLAAAASSDEEAKAMAGGSLNPTWVELLMGFPPGWTDVA
jgi:hypothetical protein